MQMGIRSGVAKDPADRIVQRAAQAPTDRILLEAEHADVDGIPFRSSTGFNR
jgi:Tat protein secretion system quality control protein TatD with DNase activity